MKKKVKTNESSVVHFLITKKQKWFGMTPFEVFLFTTGMITMLVLPFVLKAVPNGFDFSGNPFESDIAGRPAYGVWDLVLTFAAGLGIVGALMLSTKNKHAWIVLLVEAILYGANSFFAFGSYALGSINMFIVPIILVISHFFSWRRNSLGTTLETKKLGGKDIAIVISGVLVLTGSLGSLFVFGMPNNIASPNTWTGWIDALMGSIMAIAFILSALRFRETFIVFLISNIVKVFAWTIALHWNGSSSSFEAGAGVGAYAGALALAWIYLLNAIFGLMIWKKSQKVGLIKHKIER